MCQSNGEHRIVGKPHRTLHRTLQFPPLMGQIHLKYLSDVRIFGCLKCHAHLATLSSMLSRVRAILLACSLGLGRWGFHLPVANRAPLVKLPRY